MINSMKVKSVKVNAILNIIYTVTNIIFPFLTFPYVSRILFSDGIGKVSFFTSVSNYAVMIGSLGISTYGIRAVAKVRDDKKELSKVVTELLIINSIITAVVIIFLCLSCLFVEKFRLEPVLCIINALIIITAPMGLNWLYSGLEQYSYITKRTIFFKSISLVLVFVFIREKTDYFIYAGITAFSTIGSYLCNFVHARKFIEFKKYKGAMYRHHIKPMLLLFASTLAVSVYTNLDTIMLGFISGDTEVGLYTIAVKIKWLLLTAVNAISAVLLPRLSFYLADGNQSEYNRMLKKSISVILMTSIPLTFYFIAEAYDCILLLGGNDYTGAVLCMQIVMPILLISSFSNITGNQVLIPHGWDAAFMKAVVMGAIVNIIFNTVLMPKYGCAGAAVATLLAEIVQMSIQFIYAKDYIIGSLRFFPVLRYFILSVIATIVIVFVRRMVDFGILVNLITTSMIFFGIYGFLLIMMKDKAMTEILHEIMYRFVKKR